MGKLFESLNPDLQDWLAQQKVFFVATAPLAQDGHVNCSPKGGDTFRVLGERQVAYLDLTGSGIETAAHLQENGRILIMFCSFSGPPKIVRLHGKGEVGAQVLGGGEGASGFAAQVARALGWAGQLDLSAGGCVT